MFRKDYIQKQLEQLSLAIAKVIADLTASKNDGNTFEGIDLSAQAFHTEFDVSIDELIALKQEETIAFLTQQKQLIPGKLDLLADLLFATTKLYEKSGEQAIAADLLHKTLLIYEHVNQTEKTFSGIRQQHINTIKLKLYEP